MKKYNIPEPTAELSSIYDALIPLKGSKIGNRALQLAFNQGSTFIEQRDAKNDTPQVVAQIDDNVTYLHHETNTFRNASEKGYPSLHGQLVKFEQRLEAVFPGGKLDEVLYAYVRGYPIEDDRMNYYRLRLAAKDDESFTGAVLHEVGKVDIVTADAASDKQIVADWQFAQTHLLSLFANKRLIDADSFINTIGLQVKQGNIKDISSYASGANTLIRERQLPLEMLVHIAEDGDACDAAMLNDSANVSGFGIVLEPGRYDIMGVDLQYSDENGANGDLYVNTSQFGACQVPIRANLLSIRTRQS